MFFVVLLQYLVIMSALFFVEYAHRMHTTGQWPHRLGLQLLVTLLSNRVCFYYIFAGIQTVLLSVVPGGLELRAGLWYVLIFGRFIEVLMAVLKSLAGTKRKKGAEDASLHRFPLYSLAGAMLIANTRLALDAQEPVVLILLQIVTRTACVSGMEVTRSLLLAESALLIIYDGLALPMVFGVTTCLCHCASLYFLGIRETYHAISQCPCSSAMIRNPVKACKIFIAEAKTKAISIAKGIWEPRARKRTMKRL